MAYLLGLDVGSSSVKACLLDSATGKPVATATSPDTELPIEAPQPGWAEQHPHTWWEHALKATRMILDDSDLDAAAVAAIGISYQMHGLVCLDASGEVLRPAIIWCDSRAVEIGDAASAAIGPQVCLERLLNSPGNFTASKLKWVKDHEPEIYAKIARIMLPGDYLAYRLTGEQKTTPSGLSEGVLWDFNEGGPAGLVLDHYGIDPSLLPEVVPTFSPQGGLSTAAAEAFGLPAGIPVAYRGGDQPNNALSLNVLEPGEIAATAGTSGVVCGITDKNAFDPESRVNTFVHVNHAPGTPRHAVLLCINGTGILNSWLKREVVGDALSYKEMDKLAGCVPIGCDGLSLLPYGNGAERTLNNRCPGGLWAGIDFNLHTRAHYLRAAQEGIVYAMKYGLDIMAAAGVPIGNVRAGHANMFFSPVFQEAFACCSGATVELYDTDGAQGAARGAGIGAGIYAGPAEAFTGLEQKAVIQPDMDKADRYAAGYEQWRAVLERNLD